MRRASLLARSLYGAVGSGAVSPAVTKMGHGQILEKVIPALAAERHRPSIVSVLLASGP